MLWIPRVVFFVPRWAAELAFLPLRGLLWTWDRFQVGEELIDLFFDDDRVFGLMPIINLAAGFGVNVGARFLHRNLFGAHETLTGKASFGGRYVQTYAGHFDTGRRFGRLQISVDGGYLVGQNERFFGFGNGDDIARDPTSGPRDALRREAAVDARYRYDRGYASLAARFTLRRNLTVALVARMRRQTFFDDNDAAGNAAIDKVFATGTLVGFEGDLINLGGQLELRWDARRRSNPFVPQGMLSRGPLVLARLGNVEGFGHDPSSYLRYYLEAGYLLDLYRGTRVLSGRLRIEGVTAKLGALPFSEAPALGGSDVLRGYVAGRFHDRLAVLSSLEYTWAATSNAIAFLFVDVGRVYAGLSELTLHQLRVGFGGGLVISLGGFGLRLQLAGSRDGDVRFDLVL